MAIARTPGRGRYAQLEREQRWLLSAVPEGAVEAAEIHDRYLCGTTLRLRRVSGRSGTAHKLGQKVRVDAGDPERVQLTNLYLTEEEHALLASLPAAELRKRRLVVNVEGRRVAVDRFEGRWEGLVLAEAELAEGGEALPAWEGVLVDVTHDDRFSGGALAAAGEAEAAELLAEVSTLVSEALATDGGVG